MGRPPGRIQHIGVFVRRETDHSGTHLLILIGVGPGNFTADFKNLMEKKVIPPVAVYNQPHSDILHAASTGGIILLAAYFAITLGPSIYFYRRYRKFPVRSTARMLSVFGLQVVGAYFLFGLTNSGFDLQIYSTTYSVLICVLATMTRPWAGRLA